MRARRDFDIDIYSLSNKSHHYEYDLSDSFFANFEDSYLHKGSLHVNLELEKSETLILANFEIKGSIELICDRSNEPFDFEINSKNKLIFKYGEDFAELTDEIISIPHALQKINIAQYIYEFIGLAVPMKKLHPKFQEVQQENLVENEEAILIYTTGKEPESEDSKEEEIDPRWKILNGLKHNNN